MEAVKARRHGRTDEAEAAAAAAAAASGPAGADGAADGPSEAAAGGGGGAPEAGGAAAEAELRVMVVEPKAWRAALLNKKEQSSGQRVAARAYRVPKGRGLGSWRRIAASAVGK